MNCWLLRLLCTSQARNESLMCSWVVRSDSASSIRFSLSLEKRIPTDDQPYGYWHDRLSERCSRLEWNKYQPQMMAAISSNLLIIVCFSFNFLVQCIWHAVSGDLADCVRETSWNIAVNVCTFVTCFVFWFVGNVCVARHIGAVRCHACVFALTVFSDICKHIISWFMLLFSARFNFHCSCFTSRTVCPVPCPLRSLCPCVCAFVWMKTEKWK